MLGLPRAVSTWMTVPRLTPAAAASASMVIRRCWRKCADVAADGRGDVVGGLHEDSVPYFGVYCVALRGNMAVTYDALSCSVHFTARGSMSVPFALSSAVAYGFGDFAGGLAARQDSRCCASPRSRRWPGCRAACRRRSWAGGTSRRRRSGLGATRRRRWDERAAALHARAGGGADGARRAAVVGGRRGAAAGRGGARRGAAGAVAWLALVVALVAIALASAGSRG